MREQVKECLQEIEQLTKVSAPEFHFVDIYNRSGVWKGLPEGANLGLFTFFANIYRHYRWPIFLQTVDDRTFSDHGISAIQVNVDRLDTSSREDLSLLMLLLKMKHRFKDRVPTPSIHLILDEGRKKPGTPFGQEIFRDWPASFSGQYSASSSDPLLQIADFVAYCINRSTHLALKATRSSTDQEFLNMVATMKLNSEDLQVAKFRKDFTVEEFDQAHAADRRIKGLED